MYASTVTWDIYQQLRDCDISDPTNPDVDIANTKYTLGQAASWARWGEHTYDLAPITASSPDEFEQLQPLTTSVVLFALNWGGTSAAANIQPWQNFHTRGHRGDTTLRKSLLKAIETIPHPEGTAAPAPYMTDVFKLVPTQSSGKLDARIRADRKDGHDHVTRCARLLEAELRVCMKGNGGKPPLLVAMGQATYYWLTGAKEGSKPFVDALQAVLGSGAHQVELMPHYTFAVATNQEREARLMEILAAHKW